MARAYRENDERKQAVLNSISGMGWKKCLKKSNTNKSISDMTGDEDVDASTTGSLWNNGSRSKSAKNPKNNESPERSYSNFERTDNSNKMTPDNNDESNIHTPYQRFYSKRFFEQINIVDARLYRQFYIPRNEIEHVLYHISCKNKLTELDKEEQLGKFVASKALLTNTNSKASAEVSVTCLVTSELDDRKPVRRGRILNRKLPPKEVNEPAVIKNEGTQNSGGNPMHKYLKKLEEAQINGASNLKRGTTSNINDQHHSTTPVTTVFPSGYNSSDLSVQPQPQQPYYVIEETIFTFDNIGQNFVVQPESISSFENTTIDAIENLSLSQTISPQQCFNSSTEGQPTSFDVTNSQVFNYPTLAGLNVEQKNDNSVNGIALHSIPHTSNLNTVHDINTIMDDAGATMTTPNVYPFHGHTAENLNVHLNNNDDSDNQVTTNSYPQNCLLNSEINGEGETFPVFLNVNYQQQNSSLPPNIINDNLNLRNYSSNMVHSEMRSENSESSHYNSQYAQHSQTKHHTRDNETSHHSNFNEHIAEGNLKNLQERHLDSAVFPHEINARQNLHPNIQEPVPARAHAINTDLIHLGKAVQMYRSGSPLSRVSEESSKNNYEEEFDRARKMDLEMRRMNSAQGRESNHDYSNNGDHQPPMLSNDNRNKIQRSDFNGSGFQPNIPEYAQTRGKGNDYHHMNQREQLSLNTLDDHNMVRPCQRSTPAALSQSRNLPLQELQPQQTKLHADAPCFQPMNSPSTIDSPTQQRKFENQAAPMYQRYPSPPLQIPQHSSIDLSKPPPPLFTTNQFQGMVHNNSQQPNFMNDLNMDGFNRNYKNDHHGQCQGKENFTQLNTRLNMNNMESLSNNRPQHYQSDFKIERFDNETSLTENHFKKINSQATANYGESVRSCKPRLSSNDFMNSNMPLQINDVNEIAMKNNGFSDLQTCRMNSMQYTKMRNHSGQYVNNDMNLRTSNRYPLQQPDGTSMIENSMPFSNDENTLQFQCQENGVQMPQYTTESENLSDFRNKAIPPPSKVTNYVLNRIEKIRMNHRMENDAREKLEEENQEIAKLSQVGINDCNQLSGQEPQEYSGNGYESQGRFEVNNINEEWMAGINQRVDSLPPAGNFDLYDYGHNNMSYIRNKS